MMRPFQSFLLGNPKPPFRKSSFNQRGSFLQRFESKVIRMIVIGVVLLTVFQMKSIINPVDFYLRFSGDIDAPAFKYHYYSNENTIPANNNIQTVKLILLTMPENSPVKVWQQDQLLGIISKENQDFEIMPGPVSLDATEISYPVTIEIILNQRRYRLDLDGDIKSFELNIKSPVS